MKKILLVVTSCLIGFGASAQDLMTDARAVVTAAYEATGGEAWRDISSMVTTNELSIETPQGELAGTATLTMRYPGFLHAVMDLAFEDPMAPAIGEMIQFISPDTAYMKMAQGTEPLPKGTGPDYPSRELELLEKEDASFSMTVEDIEGAKKYVVTVASGEESADTVVVQYDTETLLRERSVDNSQGVELTTTYSDYRTVEGKTIAHKVRRTGGGGPQTIRTKTVVFNKDVDAVFAEM